MWRPELWLIPCSGSFRGVSIPAKCQWLMTHRGQTYFSSSKGSQCKIQGNAFAYTSESICVICHIIYTCYIQLFFIDLTTFNFSSLIKLELSIFHNSLLLVSILLHSRKMLPLQKLVIVAIIKWLNIVNFSHLYGLTQPFAKFLWIANALESSSISEIRV